MKKLSILILLFILLITGCVNATSETKKTIITTLTQDATNTSTTKKTKTTKEIDESIPYKAINNVNDETKIYITAFNDTHGQLFRNEDKMGMAEVAGIIEYNENKYNQSYIKIANGDIFQGSYVSRTTDGECFIDALNAMDITCMTLGNHEFDWTLDTIHDYWDGDTSNGEANFPLLCCNLIDSETGTKPDWIKSYMIVEYGNSKVGIIGAIGSEQESDISPSSLGSYYFDPIASYYEKSCEELRSMGVDYIILAVHDANDLYSEFATYKSTYAPDCYIYGHTHQNIEGYYERTYDGYEIPYIESYTKSMNIGEVIITVDPIYKKSVSASINHYNSRFFDYYVRNPSVKTLNLLNEKYLSIQEEGNTTIYTCSSDRELSSKDDCANFACSLINEKLGSYISFLNSGGVRTTFNKRDITVADIFELFPFDNKLVKMKMKGKDLLEYLNRRSDLLSNYSFSQFDVMADEVYDVITVDYVATASDSYIKNFCVGNDYEVTDIILRDWLVETLKSSK